MASRWSWSWGWLVVLSCSSRGIEALPLLHPSAGSPQWIDLSNPLDHNSHHWPGFLDFNLTLAFNGTTKHGFWAAAHNFVSSEHTGTHMDAPIHVGTDGTWSVDEIPLDRLVAHAAVVDIVDRCQADPDTILTPDDLKAWRTQHGAFKYPTIVLVKTGQAQYRTDFQRYWGVPADYQPATSVDFTTDTFPALHFPGIGAAAAEVLARDEAVVGVGLDTPSLDTGTNAGLDAHHILFAANKFGMENVADMSGVPASGATILALPMKIGGGTGGPTRILVRLPSGGGGGNSGHPNAGGDLQEVGPLLD